jgi:coenzyme A diphosphatase NUDT7
MEKTAELIKQITERLNRRPARIDKADRLWDAAVLVPLIDTKQGPAVLFEVRAAGLGWQPGDVCFPGGRYEPKLLCAKPVKSWVLLKTK